MRIILSTIYLLMLIIPAKAQQPRLVLPVGHTDYIHSAFFSPDEKRVITSSSDNTVKLWNTENGALLSTFSGTGNMDGTFFSGGNKILITENGKACVYDSKTGLLLEKISIVTDSLKKIFFSTNGERAVTVQFYKDSIIDVWDSKKGIVMARLDQGDQVTKVWFSRDWSKMVSMGYNDVMKVWDTNTFDLLCEIKGHEYGINAVEFSPDQSSIASVSDDQTAKIWSVKDGKKLYDFVGHKVELNTVVYSGDGKKLLTSGADDDAESDYSETFIWDLETGKQITALKTKDIFVLSASFSPYNKTILTNAYKRKPELYNIETGELIKELTGHKEDISVAAFSPSGKKILTAANDRTVKIWNTRDEIVPVVLKGYSDNIRSIHLSPDGKKLAVNYELEAFVNSAKIWDLYKGEIVWDISASENIYQFTNESFSPGSDILLTQVVLDSAVRLRNINTGKILAEIEVTSWASPVFSPDNKMLATVIKDDIVVFEINTGIKKHITKKTETFVSYLIFSPDNKKLTVVSGFTIRIWEIQTAKLLVTLKGKNKVTRSPFFSPDGKKIVVITEGNDKVWDVESGKLLYELNADNNKDESFLENSFSPDGNKLISCKIFEAVYVRDINTGSIQKTIPINDEICWSAFFAPDGERIAFHTTYDRIRIWNTKTGMVSKPGNKSAKIECMDFLNNRAIEQKNNEIIMHDLVTNKELASYIAVGKHDYIVKSAEGFYKASPGAARLIRYVSTELKTISFEQLDIKYNRPDKVLEAIGSTDTALIKSYRKAWEKRIKKLGIDTTQFKDGYSVPEADFVNRDSIDYEQKTGTLRLHIKGIDSTYQLDRFNVWVNESPLFGQRGISIKKKNSKSIDTTITIKFSQGENRIETSITNVNGTESYRMPLYVNYTPAVKQKEMIRFVGIGIDQFTDNQYNLQYSSKDIRDLAVKLKEKYKDDIVIDTLFNENVTVEKVKSLKQKLQATSVNDKVIISYSGHGLLSKDYDYYLSTYSVNFNNPEEKGLPYDELENLLDSIPARKKLMLIDACHSGEVDKEEGIAMNRAADSLGLSKGIIIEGTGTTKHIGLKNSFELMQSLFVNVGKSTGATIISAAAGNQFALERGDLKNGVFTYSLLEAMNKYSTIKISELKKIVGERVEQLTNGMQKPTSRNENVAVDWSLW